MLASRRAFLAQAATGLSAPTPPSRRIGPNDRINAGIIGVGNLGLRHIRDRLLPLMRERKTIQMVAASDIYEKAKQRARNLLSLDTRDIHHDYRDLLARPDLDAVVIVTPEHLHHSMTMAALRAGKDVYLEKPMTYTIAEAQEIAETVARSGRVLQVGSQYVSDERYHLAGEVIRKGWIGQVLGAQASSAQNSMHGIWQYFIEPEANEKTVDWNAFLGPAPKRPFSAERYFRWRKYWDYSGGMGPDLLYHNLSPLLLALGPDFPVRVSGHGGIRIWREREVPDSFSMTAEYENFEIRLCSHAGTTAMSRNHPQVIFGHEGSIRFVSGAIEVTPEPLFKSKFRQATGKDELRLESEIKDYEAIRMRHMENFFDCMRTRRKPVFDAAFGYRVMTAIRLGVDSYRQSRMIAFDPRSERVLHAAPARPGYEGAGENYQEPGTPQPDGRRS